jgi:helicase
MDIDYLSQIGFPPEIIENIKDRNGKSLLPIQEKCIREGCIFEENNLLVCAPTSSGKTFLAELVFIHQTIKSRSTILLVPTKALANQRFNELSERYKPLGYDVVLSTRDNPFDDKSILEGNFHIAVIIYEKMTALVSQNDSFLSYVGACIIDEIHYLFHPNRGADLEFLLTYILSFQHIQLLGLSAMVDDKEIANWLNAQLIVESKRPVELYQGVLCQGEFTYKSLNSGEIHDDRLFESTLKDEGHAMIEAAQYFAGLGESTLLFWPRRELCYTAARKLADLYESDDDIAISQLDRLEDTSIKSFLQKLLPKRVAIHTSDLSIEERELIEDLICQGEVVLICATSTLAEGINFPVTNVITMKRMYGAGITSDYRVPSTVPVSQDRFLNMIGRAGRYGLSNFGRGIILTTSQGDVKGLMENYIHQNAITFKSQLPRLSNEDLVLKSVRYCKTIHKNHCIEMLNQTYCIQSQSQNRYQEENIDTTLDELVSKGYLVNEFDDLYATPLGNLVIRNGLSSFSAQRIHKYIQEYLPENPCSLELFLFVSLLLEMEEVYLPVTKNQIRLHTWNRAFQQRIEQNQSKTSEYLSNLLLETTSLHEGHHRAFKRAMLLEDWVSGISTMDIEKAYGVYSGTIVKISEQASWLLGCMIDTAGMHGFDAEMIRQFMVVRESVIWGIPKHGLDWSPLLRTRILSRKDVTALIQVGYDSSSQLTLDDREYIQSILGQSKTDTLYEKRSERPTSKRISYDFCIEIDKNLPNRFEINGNEIKVTSLQYKLIDCLCKKPGSCLTYDLLLEDMWPDSVGDKKQISRQKTAVIQKIERKLNHTAKSLIETISGVGLVIHADVKRF